MSNILRSTSTEIAELSARMHRTGNEHRCACGACAHQIVVASLRNGIRPRTLMSALAPLSERASAAIEESVTRFKSGEQAVGRPVKRATERCAAKACPWSGPVTCACPFHGVVRPARPGTGQEAVV